MERKIYCLVLLLVSLSFTSSLRAQKIATILGTGTNGYSGDDTIGTQAMISTPGHIAIDTAGNLYVPDFHNNRIRKLTPGGIVTTIAGDGTAGFSGDGGLAIDAQLSGPQSVVIDDTGNIYIADLNNSRIRKINTGGIISTIAGTGVYATNGDGGPATAAALQAPADIVIDHAGNLFIADKDGNVIRKIKPTGSILTYAGNQTAGYNGDNMPATTAELNMPQGIALDTAGNLYIADNGNNRIRKVIANGPIVTIAGDGTNANLGDGALATMAEVGLPVSVALDDTGNIYIAQNNGYVIRRINVIGSFISTVAGNGTSGYNGDGIPATAAMLNAPADVKEDAYGNLVIADGLNYRVRYVCNATLNPTAFTVATPSDTILIGTPVTFTCDVRAAGYNAIYQWKKNGNDVGQDNNTYTDNAIANGDQVYCVVTMGSICAATPTVNTDTINMVVRTFQEWVAHLNSKSGLQIYPNPCTDHITIAGLNDGDLLSVYDVTGKKVIGESYSQNNKGLLQVSSLSAGNYLLIVNDAQGNRKASTVIVKQ